jgi:biopolymer transport protein ExbB
MKVRVQRVRKAAAIAALVLGSMVLAMPPVAFAQDPAKPAADAAPAPAAAPPAAPPAADAAAPAPAAVAPGAPEHETVENPYGLDALWKGGDFIARGTLIILAIMSMGSWYIIFTKVYEQFRLLRDAGAMRKTFWKSGSIGEGVKTLKDASAFRFIAQTGVDANQHHEGSLTDNIDLNTWVTMSIQRAVENVQNRLQDGLAFLGTVGSTAPFVGLFGTVWGIYHALTAIGIAGQASIDKVAGPVGEALIMTAMGLAVAVPAVLGYNWLVRRNKVAMEAVRSFGADLHSVLMGARSGTAVAARVAN